MAATLDSRCSIRLSEDGPVRSFLELLWFQHFRSVTESPPFETANYAASGMFGSSCAFVPVKGCGDFQHRSPLVKGSRHLGEMLGIWKS
jgi:hypothetical protein